MRWDDFVDYIIFTEPILSKTTEQRMNFEIARQKIVRMYIEIDKQKVDLILQDVLHTPKLHSNLILILRICF